jgi:hypothetical protein
MPFPFIPTSSSTKRCFPLLPPPLQLLPPPPPTMPIIPHHQKLKNSFTIDNLIGNNKTSTPTSTNVNSVLTITNRETFRV